jgi:hypothetical protein
MYDIPHLKAQLVLYISELLMKDNQPRGDAGLAMMQALYLLLQTQLFLPERVYQSLFGLKPWHVTYIRMWVETMACNIWF